MGHKEGIIEDRIRVETIEGIFIETRIPTHILIKTLTITQTEVETDPVMESVISCKLCNHQHPT
ncbi:MAG: hypothetical protein NTY09_02545 [bacterium]|nr:hypothetical protein [bacterium]